MVAFLMGLQRGFTKFPCHICFWDSRDTAVHYNRKHWPQRIEFSVGKYDVKCESLVDLQKVLFPPLHTKLGLMKQFVIALDKESAAFNSFKTSSLSCLRQRSKLVSLLDHKQRRSWSAQNSPRSSVGSKKKLGATLSQWFGAFGQLQGQTLCGTG
ncbi:uncharacterized protein LOC143252020 isoform X1 [Tachypleus tridentatus]|uniref:uncharacterized protein LOC143252020 isoform X1 n=1 Tax=Tachypleus tridentatus TaxID=6853 RepID=UPI003FD21E85